MEGLLDGYLLEKKATWLDAAVASASALRATLASVSELPRSQYHMDWSVANSEYCVTGLAQWAGVCFRLAQDHGMTEFMSSAESALDQIKRWQYFSRNSRLHGGLPGSKPLGGRYMRFSIPNWGVKFFIDALLLRLARA
jgi:hypothetical protein